MKRKANPLIILLILSILSSCILSSCTSTKHLHQEKTTSTTQTTTQETTHSNYQVISHTRITESQDTTVLLKGSELTASANINSLFAGDTIFTADSNLQLQTYYDSLSKTIRIQAKAKPQTISFKYHKITEKQELQTGSVSSFKSEQQQQTVQSVKKEKESSRSSLPLWLIVIIIAIFIGAICWLVYRGKHKF